MFECAACVLVRWVEPFTLRPAVTGQWQHRRMPNLATELVHLLLTPLAYVFIAIFLIVIAFIRRSRQTEVVDVQAEGS